MRVPNGGQDLEERRIVREGKRLAEAMLANYVDPPSFSVLGLFEQIKGWRLQALSALRNLSLKY
ncbi:hypothetical protein [Devosia salina]|uniref:Uncharacterized protein n=1 Tax=Devosia salina TaxID=2860336 RepID=A0ABX8WH64_9HYPH|nr:hypothetical protein [Devosia salina]QYO78056.1 hypothetical protein K1X15_05685 [Devosia salina]